MSQLALARRYRPRTFQTMIGQDVVLKILCNALELKRLHHAYLFTGMHGVGKTSIARILAKCLNCEQGISAVPCEQCFACQAIDQGHFVDLIEVDAASRTKIEDTRELLDNVQYLPTRGRFKIYLIDEVHMLSAHSFNALLKTLEEPPPHVKFLLATTDPQKLPVTVLSRCLQFSLWRLPSEKIADHLAHILQREGLAFEKPALYEIARAAEGSMRDALSILDQAINVSPGPLEAASVRAMLGLSDQAKILSLLKALAAGDTRQILTEIKGLEETTPDFAGLLRELLEVLHHIAMLQNVPEILNEAMQQREALLDLAKQISQEELQLYYQIGLQGQRDLPFAPNAKMGFEMTLLRMVAFQPVKVGSYIAEKVAEKAAITEAPVLEEASQELPIDWHSVVGQLKLSGVAKAVAAHCVVAAWSQDYIQLVLDETQRALFNKRYEDQIREALSQYLGRTLRLKVVAGQVETETPALQKKRLVAEAHTAAQETIQVDDKIQKLMQAFDAKIEKVILKE